MGKYFKLWMFFSCSLFLEGSVGMEMGTAVNQFPASLEAEYNDMLEKEKKNGGNFVKSVIDDLTNSVKKSYAYLIKFLTAKSSAYYNDPSLGKLARKGSIHMDPELITHKLRAFSVCI